MQNMLRFYFVLSAQFEIWLAVLASSTVGVKTSEESFFLFRFFQAERAKPSQGNNYDFCLFRWKEFN